MYSPKRRSPGKARPGEFEAIEKPRFVGVEADETPADRDVVQRAEDFLERLQLRNHLLVRQSRREELTAIAQALHANAHGMTLGRIFPVRTARLFHELAVSALQRRGAELGEALRCGFGLERDLREAREFLRGERAQRFLPRLGALALRTRDELPSGVSGVEALEEHVPVARAAEEGLYEGVCWNELVRGTNAIGTALAAVVTGFLDLKWWQMPLAIFGIILVVSGPAVVMASKSGATLPIESVMTKPPEPFSVDQNDG